MNVFFQKRVMHTKFDIYIFIAETDASLEIRFCVIPFVTVQLFNYSHAVVVIIVL
jgi:hypothetical protein